MLRAIGEEGNRNLPHNIHFPRKEMRASGSTILGVGNDIDEEGSENTSI